MNIGEYVTWGALVSMVLAAFLLGMAPIFVVRCAAALYPKDHPRRRELVAEMSHVRTLTKVPEHWLWLGESFATAVCEGIPARRRARQLRRAPSPYKITSVELAGPNRLVVHTTDRDIPFRQITAEEQASGTFFGEKVHLTIADGDGDTTWVRADERPGRHRKSRSER